MFGTYLGYVMWVVKFMNVMLCTCGVSMAVEGQ